MPSPKTSSVSKKQNTPEQSPVRSLILLGFLACIFFLGWKTYHDNKSSERMYSRNEVTQSSFFASTTATTTAPVFELDRLAYDAKILQLANLLPIKVITHSTTTANIATTTTTFIAATSSKGWPVKAVYPNYGALLPFNRIVAYYGNFYSKQMGVLGEYPPEEVLTKLETEVQKWQVADPSTPVIPAIHYIAAVAQASAGADGDYLSQMPDSQIDKAIDLAKQANGIVFVDIQIAHSSVLKEVHALEKYLELPQVHLGIDPEFSMKDGKKPGTVIGTLDAQQINEAAMVLAKIVRDKNLPPKILLIHRFTGGMITNAQNIKPLPEVQIVMDMDGWGPPTLKTATYQQVITKEPVQFSGIKLFYKNDLRKPSTRMLSPEEILKLQPQPSYIQYQ